MIKSQPQVLAGKIESDSLVYRAEYRVGRNFRIGKQVEFESIEQFGTGREFAVYHDIGKRRMQPHSGGNSRSRGFADFQLRINEIFYFLVDSLYFPLACVAIVIDNISRMDELPGILLAG